MGGAARGNRRLLLLVPAQRQMSMQRYVRRLQCLTCFQVIMRIFTAVQQLKIVHGEAAHLLKRSPNFIGVG
jgi:hypothetical protein